MTKVVGVLKMRNGSIIKIVEGDMEKIEGFESDDFPTYYDSPLTDGEGFMYFDFLFSLGHRHGYFCWCCKKKMPDWKPQYCCNGRECGCMGQPIEPPLCSAECWELGMEGYNKHFKHMWE